MSGGERKRLHVITWGCQMNVYDSGRMADVLAPLGYAPAAVPDGADMVILNTCHIRDKAAEKVFSELGRLRRLKAATGGRMILAVAGCVAQAEGAEILARAPYVDIVLGPQTYHRLPEMVARATRAAGSGAVIETDFPPEDKFDHLPDSALPQGVAAFLTVQEGCDKFCSFCVVPYTRGAEQSRPAAAILREARLLVSQGAREITLLGQNVNAWHGEAAWRGGGFGHGGGVGYGGAVGHGGGSGAATWGLGRLLRGMAEIPGLLRLRYATSHPRDMDDDLIRAHGDLPMLMPLLHLPVQSGSDRILAAMNRKHSAADYRRLVDRLRSVRPDLALSSDFIVGHPGETEADFEATLALVRDVGFAQAYSFKYSQRPGTPAAGAPAQVAEADKDRRLRTLQALLREQQARFSASCVGRTMPVLFTGPGRHPGQVAGRSPFLQPVHLPGAVGRTDAYEAGAERAGPGHVDHPCADLPEANLIGRELPVRIVAAHPNSLAGILVQAETLVQERQIA